MRAPLVPPARFTPLRLRDDGGPLGDDGEALGQGSGWVRPRSLGHSRRATNCSNSEPAQLIH